MGRRSRVGLPQLLVFAPLILLTMHLLTSPETDAASFEGCFRDDITAPAGNYLPVSYDFVPFASPDDCVLACYHHNYAVISVDNPCMCSDSLTGFTRTYSLICNNSCVDGSRCGALGNGWIVSAYNGCGGKVEFDSSITQDELNLDVILNSRIGHGITYNIDFGNGAPAVDIVATDDDVSVTSYTYILPGNYSVQITGFIPNTPLIKTEIEIVTITLLQELEQFSDSVVCPEVAEPDREYYCNITLDVSDSSMITTTYGDGATVDIFHEQASHFYRLGFPSPFGNTGPAVGRSRGDVNKEVVLSQYSVINPGIVETFEFYVGSAGRITYGFKLPKCSRGLVYCATVNGCTSSCPYDDRDQTFTCIEEMSFCSTSATCSDSGTIKDICLAVEPAQYVGWEWKDTITLSAQGYHVFRADVAVLPGYVLFFTGDIMRSPVLREGGDLVHGLPTDYHHYFSATIRESDVLQLGFICNVGPGSSLILQQQATSETVVSQILCERLIIDIWLNVSQEAVTAFNSSLNIEEPYYVRSGVSFDLAVMFSSGGPISISITSSPSFGLPITFSSVEDFPMNATTPYTMESPKVVAEANVYLLEIEAWNSHNTKNGLKPVTNESYLVVQHPVTESWTVTPDSSTLAFIIPAESARFKFIDTIQSSFPTNASVLIDWGDDTALQTLSFIDPGGSELIFEHRYDKGAKYTMWAYIFNIVSGYNTSCDVTIIEKIRNFTISPKYFPISTSSEARKGHGALFNLFPLDKDVVFFPEMSQGSVSSYELRITADNSLLYTYNVPDIFDRTGNHFQYTFGEEMELNLTVVAVNAIESVKTYIFIGIMGMIRGTIIDDMSIMTAKEQEKWFVVSFESLGTGACLVIDWGDGSKIETFGDELVCKTNFSHAYYNDVELNITMSLSHFFMNNGVYNATAIAYNAMSITVDTVMFVVASYPCKPPKAEIVDGVSFYANAMAMKRGYKNSLTTEVTIDCNITYNTKKRWQIFTVDGISGDVMEPLIISSISVAHKPEFEIPALSLQYGYYKVIYTITMWEPVVLDPIWPFQKQASTFIKIVESGLICILLGNAMSRVTRGLTQEIAFQPSTYSVDPDNPDSKEFTVTWRCRRTDEEWPQPDIDFPKPVFPIGPLSTGCFGYGPGLLNFTKGELILLGSDFVELNATYEMEAKIQKDFRSGIAKGQVEIIMKSAPILTLKCVVDKMCRAFEKGVYVSPVYRSAVKVECVSECGSNIQYLWILTDDDDNLLSNVTEYFDIGDDGTEFTLNPKFFDDNPLMESFHLTVTASSDARILGTSSYFMYVNQKPEGGTCNLTLAALNRAALDEYTLECSGWIDPENIGITYYLVSVVSPDNKSQPIMNMKHKLKGRQITPLIFPPGNFSVEVRIMDAWETYTVVTIYEDLQIRMPTEEEYKSVDTISSMKKAAGAGDVDMLKMLLASNAAVLREAEWGQTNDVHSEERNQLLLEQGNQNSVGLGSLHKTATFNNLGSIEVTSATLASVIKTASVSIQAAKSIDLETKNTLAKMLQEVTDDLGEVNVISPSALQNTGDNIISCISNFMMGISVVGAADSDCRNAPPGDMQKPDSFPYDTDIGYDINMEVPANMKEIVRCNIRDVSKDWARNNVPTLEDMLRKLTKAVLKTSVAGESWEFNSDNGMIVKMKKMRLSGTEFEIEFGDSNKFILPNDFCPTGNCSDVVGISAAKWPYITHSYPDSSLNLAHGTKVLSLELTTEDMEIIEIRDLQEPIGINIARTMGKFGDNIFAEPYSVDAVEESVVKSIPIIYSNFNVTKNHSAVNIEITPSAENPHLFLMLSYERLPSLKKFDWFIMVSDIQIQRNGTYDWFIPSSEMTNLGHYYVGVGQFKSDFKSYFMEDPVLYSVTSEALVNITVNYTLRIISSGCYFLNRREQEWSGHGLKTVAFDHNVTKCKSHHLTSFAAGLFVPPNTIDFSYVFANMTFTDNLTIYFTLIISLTICIFLMVWAWHMDKKDITKLGASPLPDNRIEDKYFYEILVFTGNHKGAQTDSTVQFILSGDKGETDVRTFGDDERKILRKDGTDVFVMATPGPLGNLQYLDIWHDNSGVGSNASWHLSFIVFRDIQTGQKFEFIADRWFAAERDGKIEHMFPVAGREQRTQFSHLFNTTKNRNLTDGHLWFSIFLRPPRSRFTRCQRVASCFALLFLSMLVNAMWYDTVPEQPRTGGLQLGPFNLSPEQLGVGFVSNLIVFPPSFIIILLFRKSRPRTLRKSRINLAVEKTRQKAVVNCNQPPEEELDRPSTTTSEKPIELKEKKKKFTLPWWFAVIAWLLVIVCIGASCFFLLMYGIMFGNSKATKWVTSLVISFFSSVLFVQPIKVFLTALIVSIITKKSDQDEDDADEDEEGPTLRYDEDWLHSDVNRPQKHQCLDQKSVEEYGKIRQKEIQMYAIIKEIMIYAVFIWILLILSHGNRDPNAFYLQKSLKDAFLNEGARDGTDYTKVRDSNRLWFYLHSALLPKLRADLYYNGKPPYGLKGFLGDHSNRIMGYATIRQIRAMKDTCRIPKIMQNTTTHCSSYSTIEHEDDRDFCKRWILPTDETIDTIACNTPEFKYTRASELDTLPLWGNLDWYSGGGYVIHLRGPTYLVLENFDALQRANWIDEMTRAVIIEFSTYNSQVNLFGLSFIIAEFAPGGGIISSYRFEGIRLLQHHDNFGLFIFGCEIIFIIFVIYYTVMEICNMISMKKNYFKSYWSYGEIAIVLASYSLIIVYILRYYVTKAVLQVFDETYGNGYVNIEYAASLNEIYLYLMAFLNFVGSLKFIKLFRFNKRMGILSTTLRQCWDDLSGFLVAFFLCFFSFVIMFYLLLNMHLEGFYSFISAIETGFSMMLGKFEFQEMKEASLIMPIMFFVFVVCNSWVVINLLLTVVIQKFMEVKHDLLNQPSDYQIVDFVWNRFKKFIGHGSPPLSSSHSSREDKDQEPSQQQKFDQVNELPEKFDKFLEYINSVYFDNNLGHMSKTGLKSSLYKKTMPRHFSGNQDRSGNDPYNVRNKSGISGNSAHHDTQRRRRCDEIYEGPRISNAFQASLDDV